MYQKDASRYAELAKDMEELISTGGYDLYSNFDAMWNDENEFCVESIFESNQLPKEKHGQVVGKDMELTFLRLFLPMG
ncbi:MAG: hypothetical protein R2738_05550 [Bacteroides graminisolvens]